MNISEMYDAAMKLLETMNDAPFPLPEPQITVLLGESGQEYFAPNDVTGDICVQLKKAGETAVLNTITVWKNGSIDLPSITFRRALCLWNRRSLTASVVMSIDTENSTIRMKQLIGTLPEPLRFNLIPDEYKLFDTSGRLAGYTAIPEDFHGCGYCENIIFWRMTDEHWKNYHGMKMYVSYDAEQAPKFIFDDEFTLPAKEGWLIMPKPVTLAVASL